MIARCTARWENNIKMDLREMRGKGVEWIEPALFVFLYCTSQELTQGREGQPGYSPPQIEILKTMIL